MVKEKKAKLNEDNPFYLKLSRKNYKNKQSTNTYKLKLKWNLHKTKCICIMIQNNGFLFVS